MCAVCDDDEYRRSIQITWPESLREAPRFTNILQACLLTLIANQLTLVDLPRLLMNKDWREELLDNVDDPEVVAVFP